MAKATFLLSWISVLFLVVALPGGASSGNVACSDSFTGTTYDLTVPAKAICEVTNATITHDLVVKQGGWLYIARTTIGNDLLASKPETIQTGHGAGPDRPIGRVNVGHNFSISGSPNGEAFHGLCDLAVGNDLSITDTRVDVGFTVGDDDSCARFGYPANTISRDLIIKGNTSVTDFDCCPSSILVGNNTVGRNLVVAGNRVVPPGVLEVSDNRVAGNATCAHNQPAPSPDDSSDSSNIVGGTNTCG
jgi:hypothetical protein